MAEKDQGGKPEGTAEGRPAEDAARHKVVTMNVGEQPGAGISVKVAGEWELDVLGAPYGGPHGGKDSDGEYFSPETNFHLDKFPNPLVMYYHGYGPEGNPQGNPDVIGKVESYEQRSDGVWYRVILDKTNEFARRVWEAAQQGAARASSGSISHLVRRIADGLLTNWPIVELSLFDTGEEREPANNYAVALPVIKSFYKQAGIEMPELPEAEGSEGEAKGTVIHRANPVPESIGGKDDSNLEDLEMDEERLVEILDARDAIKEKAKAEATQAAEVRQKEIDEAVEKAVKEARKKDAEGNRLDSDKDEVIETPVIAKNSELWKYDNLDAADQAFMVGILSEGALVMPHK